MDLQPEPIRIEDVERFRDGIIVGFSDGEWIFFDPAILHSVRNFNGNRNFTDIAASVDATVDG